MKKEILQKGEKAVSKAFLLVAFLALLKVIFGFLSGSIALISDSFHSLGDALSLLFVWLGFHIAQRKPTEKFPYGFYKIENISALFVSLLMLFASFELFKEGIMRITSFQPLRLPLLAALVALSDALAVFFLGRYELKIGQEVNSQSLIAEGKEGKLHIFSSFVVFLAILSSSLHIQKIEGLVAIFIALLVLKIALETGKESVYALLDVSPNKDFEKNVRKVILSQEGVDTISQLRLRVSGPFVFGQARVKLKGELDLKKANQIARDLEERVRENVEQIDDFSVVVAIPRKEKEIIVIPLRNISQWQSTISDQLSRAKAFAFLTKRKEKTSSLSFKENPYLGKEIRAGLSVANFLLSLHPDILVTKEIGPIAFHTLRNNFVRIYKGEGKNLQEVVNNLLEGKLKILQNPTVKRE